MARRRHTSEQIIRKLRETDRMLGEGKEVDEVVRNLEVDRVDLPPVAQPVRRDNADEAKRLRELERANARLERIVADKKLGIDGLGEIGRELVARGGDSSRGDAPAPARISQRRASAMVGQHRSTQCHAPQPSDPVRELRAKLRRFARDHPRWG